MSADAGTPAPTVAQRLRPWVLDALALAPAFVAGLILPYALIFTLFLGFTFLIPPVLMGASAWFLSRRHGWGSTLLAVLAVTALGWTALFLLLYATQTPLIGHD